MKDSTVIWVLFTLFCLMTGVAIFQTYSLSIDENCNFLQYNNSCDMRFPMKNLSMINGVYHNPYYFCVWTEDRSREEISATTFHELAHYYNYHFREHFSGDFDTYNYSRVIVNEK